MLSLTKRYPSVSRLNGVSHDTADNGPKSTDEVVEPYLEWFLTEIDPVSSDILIRKHKNTTDITTSRDLLILCGELALSWLRRQKTTAV